MKKLMKLLALALAVTMLLPSAALAAENGGEDGPRLVWNWLDWDEEGRTFVSDDALSGRNMGDEELHMAPGDENYCIFFTIGTDGKRTPVVPTAGKGVTVEKLDKDQIAPGAKQSQYYVRVRIDGWADGELTSGKTAMKVVAELPDVGLYTTMEATQKSYIRNDQQPIDPSQLTDQTVYLVRNVSDDPNQRQITDVKKNGHGNSNLYDLEQVSDNVWKITLKIPEDGGVGVNLDITFQETDGNSYPEERGWSFEYPHGPELWLRWLDMDEMGLYIVNDENEAYPGFQPHPGEECALIFYTCEYDDKGNQTLTPVPAKDLAGSQGVTFAPLQSLSLSELSNCFVMVTVADWEKNYSITSGEYTMQFDSNLPEISLYSKPEATTATYALEFSYSPTFDNEIYIISTATDEEFGRHIENLSLSKDGEDNKNFSLEKVSDNVYKLSVTDIDAYDLHAWFDITWCDADGNSYTEPWDAYTWSRSAIFASDEHIEFNLDAEMFAGRQPYADVKDSVSTAITLKAGESKTIYLSYDYYREDLDGWMVQTLNQNMLLEFRCSDPALTLTAKDGGYVISCDKAGTYTIAAGMTYPDISALYHEDGTKYTDAELLQWNIDTGYYVADGKVMISTEDGFVPFEEAFPGQDIDFEPVETVYGWEPVTVTVESSELPFTDVKAGDWYEQAVRFASSKGYMNGSDGRFNPEGKIQGVEFAQLLYNMAGKPAAAEGASFQGVTGTWYEAAMLWAAGKGIVTDTGDTAVVPEANLTRQQIALMLYTYLDKPEGAADLSAFSDAGQIAAWAKPAMEWAVSAQVFKGSDGKLNPTGAASRAEVAQLLLNYFG